MAVVSRAISAQNQFTSGLAVGNKRVGISVVSSALNATITLQRKETGADDATYVDIASWTSNVQKVLESVGPWTYRIGCKTGGFTSATGLIVSLAI